MKSLKTNNKLFVKPGTKVNLKDWKPSAQKVKSKESTVKELDQIMNRISKLQTMLYAENKRSLLIVLQGIDTAGKDGTIRHVMGALNPQSCRVESFKVPSTEELSHDYLWRVHRVTPSKGEIVIFNRSHYEDVLEARVHNIFQKSFWSMRYQQICDFERYLTQNDIEIIKFFLHISKDEQKKRLEERMKEPTKQWKISEND